MISAFDIEQEYGPHACVVRLVGDVDISVVPELRRRLGSILESGCANLVLDFGAVTYADSSALGLLVWLDHHLQPAGGRLVLSGANADITRILELSGLSTVALSVSMSANLAAALEGLDLVKEPEDPLWRREVDVPVDVDLLSETREVIANHLRPLGLPESTLFDIKVALGEALANAIRHGAPAEGEARVRTDVLAFSDRVVLEVMDNGAGFDGVSPGSDDLYAPGGRGVMFMTALMDRIEYARSPLGGTLVRLTKHRPAAK